MSNAWRHMGHCQKCGDRRPLNKLMRQWNGVWACIACYDSKHPQLSPKRIPPDRKRPAAINPTPSTARDTLVDHEDNRITYSPTTETAMFSYIIGDPNG